ncbi:MAG: lysine--tRNA ligase [Candidatus Portnoybacteria bacterium CG10_big_fil_rev_8_21_14_0_10_36_7]|uniref:Lysine--tRNA ligase n=1 Tax=Candidatus Portnoybacteria bacterium CG10_big_fil_rev_8_21_14_0_10_36_7 TaxID=1974812 RepID=A0A2M8KE14_9BACT|nr:MAG: lysine--tRNA ligase [Candidatus Portnoybacteria bacterium CG10_big_fil_rev_8_21_14_0_10_36_7]
MSLEKIKQDRINKLEAIRKSGINPYPSKSDRDFLISQAIEQFNKLSGEKKKVTLAGRIIAKREHGGSTFCNIKDISGQIQIYFKEDSLGQEQYSFFLTNFDIGDFVEAAGILFETKKGEKTLQVSSYKILAKTINQLPEKWSGLQDVEERLRRRYLDLLSNEKVMERFILRAKIIKAIRNYLEVNDFMEVETPILQSLYGGAAARPFKTHLNALDMDLYLRIAPELYLKRLLVGGFEKIYEIGRCFRNEGMDATHNPDFTMLEFYWAYADYEMLMNFTETMFASISNEVFGSEKVKCGENEIDFNGPYEKISMRDLILKFAKIDIDKTSDNDLLEKIKEIDGDIEKEMPRCKMIDEIYKTACRSKLINPTFVINHPLEMNPLAKSLETEPEKAARFQLIVGGMELTNAFSELNDSKEQERRMKAQDRHKDNDEAMPYDKDFIEALEYGMPPTAGFGMGIDRLVSLLTGAPSLRESILFPTMKDKSK